MSFASVNPATGETLKTFEMHTAAEIEAKLARAAAAFRSYRRTTFAERAQIITRVGELLLAEKDQLARVMTQKACALYDAGFKGAGEASNMAKYAAAEACVECVDQAIQVHGGNGIALEYGLTDMWWGARLNKIAPVSREMILNYVAEHVLGLPRSY